MTTRTMELETMERRTGSPMITERRATPSTMLLTSQTFNRSNQSPRKEQRLRPSLSRHQDLLHRSKLQNPNLKLRSKKLLFPVASNRKKVSKHHQKIVHRKLERKEMKR